MEIDVEQELPGRVFRELRAEMTPAPRWRHHGGRLKQAEAGRRTGTSRRTVSRLETGGGPLSAALPYLGRIVLDGGDAWEAARRAGLIKDPPREESPGGG